MILWDEWADEHTWDQITAAGTFDTHNPSGYTLYEARRRACKALNLRRIIACGRLPGYHSLAHECR